MWKQHFTLRSVALLALVASALVPAAHSHTWLFTRGRATMQASLDRPFRARITQAGQVSPPSEARSNYYSLLST